MILELAIQLPVLLTWVLVARWQRKHLNWGFVTAGKRAWLGVKGVFLAAFIALVEHIVRRGSAMLWEWPLWASVYVIALATYRRMDIIHGKGKPPDEDEEL